jgi:hypothetical protein
MAEDIQWIGSGADLYCTMKTCSNGSNLYTFPSHAHQKAVYCQQSVWCPSGLLLHLFVVTSQNATPYIKSKFSISHLQPNTARIVSPITWPLDHVILQIVITILPQICFNTILTSPLPFKRFPYQEPCMLFSHAQFIIHTTPIIQLCQ